LTSAERIIGILVELPAISGVLQTVPSKSATTVASEIPRVQPEIVDEILRAAIQEEMNQGRLVE
jgi:hypothetical protein